MRGNYGDKWGGSPWEGGESLGGGGPSFSVSVRRLEPGAMANILKRFGEGCPASQRGLFKAQGGLESEKGMGGRKEERPNSKHYRRQIEELAGGKKKKKKSNKGIT